MQILIKVLDKTKKAISPTSSLYDRGWNDALEKAKELLTSYNPVVAWIPTELMLPPEPDEDVDIEELPQYTVTIKGAEWPTSLRYIGRVFARGRMDNVQRRREPCSADCR